MIAVTVGGCWLTETPFGTHSGRGLSHLDDNGGVRRHRDFAARNVLVKGRVFKVSLTLAVTGCQCPSG